MEAPEKKRVMLMLDIAQQCSKPGADPFLGMFSTAKACLLRDKHMRFLGSEEEVGRLQKFMIQSLVEV